MDKHSRLATAAVAAVVFVSQGALSQDARPAADSSGGGQQDMSGAPSGGANAQPGNAAADADAASGQPRMKGHHEGASRAQPGAAHARSQKMSQ